MTYTVFYTTCPDNKKALKLLKFLGKYGEHHLFDNFYNERMSITDIAYCYDGIERAEFASPAYFFKRFHDKDDYTLVCLDTYNQRNFIGVL